MSLRMSFKDRRHLVKLCEVVFKVDMEWDEIVQVGMKNNEEHIFKLVQVCHENAKEYGDEDGFHKTCAIQAIKLTSFVF